MKIKGISRDSRNSKALWTLLRLWKPSGNKSQRSREIYKKLINTVGRRHRLEEGQLLIKKVIYYLH